MGINYLVSQGHVANWSFSGKILNEIRREFGAEVEPFTLHLALPELLAGAWMACRETLLTGSGRRDAKEIAAASVSALNRCPYCIDAHAIMVLASAGADYSDALFSRESDRIKEPYLRSVAEWAAATRTPGSPLLTSPPFSTDEAPEFIGTAIFFHYINRLVTILLGPSPLPFTSGVPKKVALRLAAWFFGAAVRLPKEPGSSLDLLPEAPLPGDMLWAESSPSVAGAFARFAEAIEKAASRTLSEKIRGTVYNAVESWNGIDPGMDTFWCEKAISSLNEKEKSAARLALLSALAPYRVDERVVRSFSASFPGNDPLLSTLAWSSFTAARKIGTWL